MTEKEVLVDLYVDLGIAYQKAAERLASSNGVTKSTITKNVDIEEGTIANVGPTTIVEDGHSHGLANMSSKEAMELVTATEDAETLKSIGAEEKARNSKARKGVLTAVQSKLNKLKNPPPQAEVATVKSFTSTTPATTPADVKLFTKQFQEMSEDQRNKYFNGEVDSLGKSLVANTESDGEFEDLGLEETKAPTSSITQEDLRAKLQAYAKVNGPEKAYAILATFNVKKIKDLEPSQYGDVAAELA